MPLCSVTSADKQKTDGGITEDFVLSFAQTAQTKTKLHKFHDFSLGPTGFLLHCPPCAETSGSSEGSHGEKV